MSIRHARTAWISTLALTVTLAGCATSQEELLPTHGQNMADIWRQATAGGTAPATVGGGTTHLDQARAALRRPLAGGDLGARRADYTRTATNEIHSQFARLPNPDLTLYVFPHLSGGAGEHVPIPGYTTIFPLYTHPHYGQPGERVAAWADQ